MSEFPYPYDANLPVEKLLPPKLELSQSARKLIIQLAMLAGLSALVNTIVVPISMFPYSATIPGALWFGFSVGIIGAEWGILVIAAVLGPGKCWLRHLAVTPLAACFIFSWLFSIQVARWLDEAGIDYSGFSDWNRVFAIILLFPLIICACELPLWTFRVLLRWRIELVSPTGCPSEPSHLSIGGILIATAAVAMALASTRWGYYLAKEEITEPSSWGELGFVLGIGGVISLVTLPFCTWATLRCRSLLVGLLTMTSWLVVAAVCLLVAISVLERRWPPTAVYLTFTTLIVGYTLGLAVPLTLIRIAGYRLLWGRESSLGTFTPSASAATPAESFAPQP